MEQETLELEIKSKANEAKESITALVKSLTNIENVLTNIYLEMGHIEKSAQSTVKSASDGVDKVNKKLNETTKISNTLKKVLSIPTAKQLVKSAISNLRLGIDRSEQLNLFNVVFKNIKENGEQTFSDLGKSATQFQNKLNDVFGTNLSDTLKYQSLFQSMGENVGIGDTYSAIMSETMTKLTYDLASLYNKDESTVAEALRAGVYAGQTKPLRAYGVDVTQTSMTPILEELGITDRSVKQMSQAEKEILRYIATLKQAKVAMGDYANTIDSPANQQKVFNNLIVETRVALGNLFTGIYANLLPAVNGVLMVIKELAVSLADFLGIEIGDYNTSIASQIDIYGDLSGSIDDATDSVKELKRQTLGFDEIHNINENKDSGNSTYSGIDQRLLDAIRSYDNGMNDVKMKASEIKEEILSWLGFTAETDETTGKTVWRLTDANSNFKKILTTVEAIGVALAGWKITKSVTDFLNWYDKSKVNLSKAVGITLLVSGLVFSVDALRKELDGDMSLGTALEGVVGGLSAGAGTWKLTHNVTATLAVMAITLVPQAVVEVKSFFEEYINPFIEENGGYWKTWWEGVKIDIDFVKDKVGEMKDWINEKFNEIGASIFGNQENWDTFKEVVSNVWHFLKGDWAVCFSNWLGDMDVISEELGINEEDWNGWKRALTNIFLWFTGDWKGLSKSLKSDFDVINSEIENNGGFWQSWKSGVKEIWEDTKTKFREKWNKSSFKEIHDAIEENGGLWENWKNGVTNILNDLGLSRFFTKEYWSNLFSNMVSGASSKLDELKSKFENWSARIKTPHFEWTTGAEASGWVKNVLEALNLPTSIPKLNVSWYANGGFPDRGTIFGAGENGPEVLGHINGRTEVLNQSQLASVMYSAVLAAMQQSGGQEVDVRFHSDGSVVIDEINRKTKQTGVCPINIPA